MKNKKFVFALMFLILGTLCSNAQSTLQKKLRADLEQSKKHREAMLLKAREQQRQNERRSEMNLNIPQQKNGSATSNSEMKQQTNPNNIPALKEQPINTPAKKEDINQ
jgi:hypothetical protein